jgi:glycerol dehydrogenase
MNNLSNNPNDTPKRFLMKIFGSPFRYIQGPGAIAHLGDILAPLGERYFLIFDEVVKEIIGNRIADSLHQAGKNCHIGLFGGECCKSEILKLKQQAQKEPPEVIIGVGGGKTADTAKVLSIELELPVVIVPTIASNDAPTSHFAVVYNENHVYDHMEIMKLSPWYVVVDTEILVKAPKRFFVAGIGDAIATKFEAEANANSGANNYFEGQVSQAALALADQSWQIIKEKAFESLQAIDTGIVNQAFEDVVEATILLSGLGFENGGLAAAHSISSGFTFLDQTRGTMHGEMVAFGLLVQFMLEERPKQFLNEMFSFYQKVGLPVTLAELGIKPSISEKLVPAMETICGPASEIHNMPFEIHTEMVARAILKADLMGEALKG